MPTRWTNAVAVLGLLVPAAVTPRPAAAAVRPLQSGANLGTCLSLSGGTAVVGATYDDTAAGADAGSAYVFVRSGTAWSQQARLVASDGAPGAHFGTSASLSGDTVILGARFQDATGAAYVFVRSGGVWTEQQKLVAPDAAAGDYFGAAVALQGDTAVVGAFYQDEGGTNAGAAYVFVRSGTIWSFQQKLVSSDLATGHRFGTSVALSGETALVGAPGGDAAYAFVRSGTTWAEQQKLVPADGGTEDYFGEVAALSGDTAVLGSPYDNDPGGTYQGSAYVFVRAGTAWGQQQKLVASDGAAFDNFGHSVSVSGDTALVGKVGFPGPPPIAGSVYAFVRSGSTWTEQQKLGASDATAGDRFGAAAAVAGDMALAGAPSDDHVGGVHAGSAYVLVRSGTTWTEEQKLIPAEALPSRFYAVAPCRVLDTRAATPLAPSETRTFPVAGSCGVAADARAVAVSVIAVNPTGLGYLSVYPPGVLDSQTSTLNVTPGRTRANNALMPLGSSGALSVYCLLSEPEARTHFVLDVYGYFK
jgi:hypothetical protein